MDIKNEPWCSRAIKEFVYLSNVKLPSDGIPVSVNTALLRHIYAKKFV